MLPVTLVRSPTFTNSVDPSTLKASSPDRRSAGGRSGTARGAIASIAPATAAMCSGVVPQQPPAMFTKPARANSDSSDAVTSGVSSKPVSDIGFGSPALGYTHTKVSALRDSSSMYGRISAAPSAQFRPTVIGRAWRMEFQKASTVWPDRIRPDASVTVPEIMIGSRRPVRSKNASIANSAALALSVSKTVSTSSTSTPPSTSASICAS